MATGFARGIEAGVQLPASERFFAGGDTTVRGFALDRLGTPEVIDADGFPVGGNGVIILNAELRVPVMRFLGVVGFVDSGNVFKQTTDIDLGRLRATTGFGVRVQVTGRTDSRRRRIQAGSPGDHPGPSRAAQRVAHLAGSGVLRS